MMLNDTMLPMLSVGSKALSEPISRCREEPGLSPRPALTPSLVLYEDKRNNKQAAPQHNHVDAK
jgi:hypothetical protein